MDNNVVCSVVVPMYNEEEVILETYRRLKAVMEDLKEGYEIVFVNDGSKDRTAELIREICQANESVKFVDFSRNFGQQVAVTAGMDYTVGECIVVIDGDLQDPPELIQEMIAKWREGYDVVYAKRMKRKGETLFKKVTSILFYRILKGMTDVDIPVDTGDYRLIDRKVCDCLKKINERNRYVRGIISWLGFKQTGVEFVREERFAGVTKYPLKKMIKFALDAITSFSYKPLKIAIYIGFLLSFSSFTYLLIVICQKIFFPENLMIGWASILAVNLFFNGIVLLILGIMGEYIGRIYEETKGRPLYVVKELKNINREKVMERYK